jgi:phenylalanyl-tRNA synthetase beta chain
MIVGVLKEIKLNENRVCMTPPGVEVMRERGHTVLVEADAGERSGFSDQDYLHAGAEVVESGFDVMSDTFEKLAITLRVSRTNNLLGTKLDAGEIVRCLESIELEVEKNDAETLTVTIPTFRVDLEREVDLIEEVARLQGYNEIPTAMPVVPMSFPEQQPGLELRKKLAALLVSQGFYEAINYSFVDEDNFDRLKISTEDPVRNSVRLLNPLTEDQSIMRTMMLPSLLHNMARNTSRQNNDIRLFEIGKVFLPVEGQELPSENMRLAGVLSGRKHPGSSLLHFASDLVDIYDCKGIVEAILQNTRLAEQVSVLAGENAGKVPSCIEPDSYIVFKAAEKGLGMLGKIDSEVARNFGIKQEIFFFDLDFDHLAELQPEPVVFSQLPKFPAVDRDIAMVVPERVGAGDLLAAINTAGEKLVESSELFDVYRGESIGAGNKSVAITLTYRSVEHTLDDSTVNKVHQRLIEMLESKFQGRLRDAG